MAIIIAWRAVVPLKNREGGSHWNRGIISENGRFEDHGNTSSAAANSLEQPLCPSSAFILIALRIVALAHDVFLVFGTDPLAATSLVPSQYQCDERSVGFPLSLQSFARGI